MKGKHLSVSYRNLSKLIETSLICERVADYDIDRVMRNLCDRLYKVLPYTTDEFFDCMDAVISAEREKTEMLWL